MVQKGKSQDQEALEGMQGQRETQRFTERDAAITEGID